MKNRTMWLVKNRALAELRDLSDLFDEKARYCDEQAEHYRTTDAPMAGLRISGQANAYYAAADVIRKRITELEAKKC